jgi:hypothetical protein
VLAAGSRVVRPGIEVSFTPDPYVTCLDLGSYGAVLTVGWDRNVAQTRAEAKDLERKINAEWIYPPVDDAATTRRRSCATPTTARPGRPPRSPSPPERTAA